jgi:hypothetical protein
LVLPFYGPIQFPSQIGKTGREKGKEKEEGRDGYGRCGKGCPAADCPKESMLVKSVPGESKLKTAGSMNP